MRFVLLLSSAVALLAGAILFWWDAADGTRFSRAMADVREVPVEAFREKRVIDPWGNSYVEAQATGAERSKRQGPSDPNLSCSRSALMDSRRRWGTIQTTSRLGPRDKRGWPEFAQRSRSHVSLRSPLRQGSRPDPFSLSGIAIQERTPTRRRGDEEDACTLRTRFLSNTCRLEKRSCLLDGLAS